jgi:putative ABC transport system permease protein
MVFQDALKSLIGFSSEEMRFLEAVRQGSPAAQRDAFQQALSSTVDQAVHHYSISRYSSSINLISESNKTTDPSGPVDIPLPRLFLSALPLILLVFFSAILRLGLHGKLGIAVVRCASQLSILGYILVPIFVSNTWWLTVIYTLFMLLVAAAEAVSRPAQAYDGMLFAVLAAMGIACSVSITFGLAVIVRVTPWYDAQYLIPMLGMLLGNSCSSVAVGLSAVLEELSSGKEKVEALLVLGATRVEATRDVVVRAIRLSLTPLLNSMNVVGIVSIPGMMTGQILGGSDPSVAARYQIIIFFLVALSSSASAIATVYAAVLTVCDSKHRLRAEKLKPRTSRTSGAVTWIVEQAKQGYLGVKSRVNSAGRKFRRAFQTPPAARSRHRFSSYLAAEEGRGGGEEAEVEQPLLPTTPTSPMP